MIWRVAISSRFKDSRAEIKTWTFEELINAHILIEALDTAEAEARDAAQDRIEAERNNS